MAQVVNTTRVTTRTVTTDEADVKAALGVPQVAILQEAHVDQGRLVCTFTYSEVLP